MSGDGFGHGKKCDRLEETVVCYHDRIKIYEKMLAKEVKEKCPSLYLHEGIEKCSANIDGVCCLTDDKCPVLFAIKMSRRAHGMQLR